MSELLPSLQAHDIQEGLLDYLATTFALADEDAQRALREFLEDPGTGIFKGPYARLRLPFRAASDGWQGSLEWTPPFAPYVHQAAAFARLTSRDVGPDKPRPLPTLVTTGTGSGKTEAFLYPILDHVLRARRSGVTGTKALILYPMNALANDQAKRLTELLTQDPALAGITAALYTGENGPKRTKVSTKGLITERAVIRSDPPDILLTNYKMLDQLLLRHEDQNLWKQSARSLQYLVLDEFHTYDGAQGTDVAMLLRRLGLALKSHLGEGELEGQALTRPLGNITPVATSATLGDKGDPAVMLEFAETVFGDEFGPESIVTESRQTLTEWTGDAVDAATALGFVPRGLPPAALAEAVARFDAAVLAGDAADLTAEVFAAMFEDAAGEPAQPDAVPRDPGSLLTLAKGHQYVRELAAATAEAQSLRDLADSLLPAAAPAKTDAEDWLSTRVAFLTHLLAAISHVRAVCGDAGLAALNVDLHLWVREVTRLDRAASSAVRYLWSDDGALELDDVEDAHDGERRPAYPAIYCRNCGRSGWGVSLAATGSDLDTDQTMTRRLHVTKEGRFRALLHAQAEDDRVAQGDGVEVEELRYLDVLQNTLLPAALPATDPKVLNGWVLPVITQVGKDADEASANDTCPSCQKKDSIRFLGSAIATLLSVTLSTLFGAAKLDAREKKALVFTDSVQDAAHRAGFVESRSHALTMRSIFRDAVGDSPLNLEELVEAVLREAGDDPFKRHRLIPPDLVMRDEFSTFWSAATQKSVAQSVRTRVRRRLLFDAVLEFGMQSRVGRTLELTGSVMAEVEAGKREKLVTVARSALEGAERVQLDMPDLAPSDDALVAWVRGTLEYMRQQGAVDHEWFHGFVKEDGRRWMIWGGRPRSQGMPAFPPARPAPEFPRVGKVVKAQYESLLTNVTNAQSWYARWTKRVLKVPTGASPAIARELLARLAKAGIIQDVTTESGASVYRIPEQSVVVSLAPDAALAAGGHLLACDTCHNVVPGTATVIAQLHGAPCVHARCPGTLAKSAGDPTNYYRRFYASQAIRRIVAREHTGLLDDDVRREYEEGFKRSGERPEVPNVLVATPTLEMGIDIGDLSTVLLSSLPKSVASYLQRVGRAGRLTGNALNIAFVTGRGEQLPRLGDPLSVINGEVRPPATYLSAEEILKRQYVAHLVDAFARDASRQHPKLASAAMASSAPGSFLGDVIEYAEADSEAHLDRFLATFATLKDDATAAVRDWATPSDGPGTSSLAGGIHLATQRWASTVAELEYRLKAIQEALPGLKQAFDHPARTDEQRRDYHSGLAAERMTKHQLRDMRSNPKTAHWIGALERFGILPNYTLLDDGVTLDVGVTWIDPDTDTYESAPVSYTRASQNALREFAPGATFYAGGLEIEIDAVDLGIDGSGVRPWAYCSACGFAQDMEPGGKPLKIHECPRCGNKGIADTKQHVDTVELTRVTAEVRRDEAAIADSSDERKRTQFTMLTAADIDPAHVTEQWYLDGYDFGARYLNQLTVRWINAGRASAFSGSIAVGGLERPAGYFHLCAGCGKLDRNTSTNEPRAHRTWCRYRTAKEPNNRRVVLKRTLVTQGVVIRLPLDITMGDDFAVPSLMAALLLGLRDQLGGAPDHIDVTLATDPHHSDDGDTYPSAALLLHDIVPGGTGYLAELAKPEKVRDLLYRAWKTVSECPCREESRLACHRCLLPFTNSHTVNFASREAAERHLRTLLLSGSQGAEAVPAAGYDWAVTDEPPEGFDLESHLEKSFRKLLTEMLTKQGATIKQSMSAGGVKLAITLPGSPLRWTLEPQVTMRGVKPDFVLRCSDHNVPLTAIFTDGHRFHATQSINRIADDATKRQGLRDEGHVVVAVTAADITAHESGDREAPPWLGSAATADLLRNSATTFKPKTVATFASGPLETLVAWISEPGVDDQRRFADAAPWYFATAPEAAGASLPEDVSVEAAARDALAGAAAPFASPEAANAWVWRRDAVAVASRVNAYGAVETAVVLDDSDAAIESAGHAEAWRLWLEISNALCLRTGHTVITATSLDTASAPLPGTVGDTSVLEDAWAEAIGFAADDVERAFLVALAEHGGIRLPELGLETPDGLPLAVSWPRERITVSLGLSATDISALESDNWQVVEPQPSGVAVALAAKGRD